MKAKDCLFVIFLLLAFGAMVCGVFCLGISLIQLVFGTGRNIVMAYCGFCLLVSGKIIGKIVSGKGHNACRGAAERFQQCSME